MENERFDAVVRTLEHGATRRGALGLLAGAVGLGMSEAAATRRANKAKRRKRNGKAKDGVRTEKAAKGGKVTLCHHDGKKRVREITVAESAVAAHLKHGDFVRGQCCVDGDCPDGQGCDLGRCATVREVCLDGCETSSLAAALEAAQDGDVIRLGPGRYRTLPLFCNARVTLVGAGSGADEATNTIIDAEQSGRVLELGFLANVELRDLKITGGRAVKRPGGVLSDNDGGGILTFGTLRLIGVDIADNHAAWRGGGIWLQFPTGSLTLRNTTIRSNTAGADGGGIWALAFDGSVTLQDGSVVEGNRALGVEGPPAQPGLPGAPEPPAPVYGRGGGILATSALTLQDGSSVRDNVAATLGGGIFAGPRTRLEAGSRVTGNTAGEQGGGIMTLRAAGMAAVIDARAVVRDNAPDDIAVFCPPGAPQCA